MCRILLLSILFLILRPLPVHSLENRWHFEFFPSPPGVVFGETRHLAETKDGTIWIGTETGGVLGINGTETRWYNQEDGLVDDNVTSLETDGEGGLWVGSHYGLSYIQNETVETLTPQNTPGMSIKEISTLQRMRDGSLWVGSRNGQIDSLSKNSSGNSIWESKMGSEITGGATVLDILETEDGKVWIGLEGNVALHHDGTEWRSITSEGNGSRIHSHLLEDSSGTIWSAGDLFLHRFDGESWIQDSAWKIGAEQGGTEAVQTHCIVELESGDLVAGTLRGLRYRAVGEWLNLPFDENIGEPEVVSVLESGDGSLWIGTQEGVIRGNPRSWKKYETTDRGTQLNGPTLQAEFDDLLLCADDMGGLAQFEKEGWEVKYQFPGPILSMTGSEDRIVWAIWGDQIVEYSLPNEEVIRSLPVPEEVHSPRILRIRNEIWFLGKSTVFYLDGDRFTPHPRYGKIEVGDAFDVAESEEGGLYILRNGLIEFDNGQGLENLGTRYPDLRETHFTSILYATDGVVWLGTHSGALVYLDDSGVHQIDQEDGLIGDPITRIYQSSDGSIWIAYKRKGIASYRDGRLVNFTHEHGVPNGPVAAIGEGPNQQIWFATNTRGLYRYTPELNPPETEIKSAPEEIGFHGVGILTVTGIDAWNATHIEHLAFSWRFVPLSGIDSDAEWSPFSLETTVLTPSLAPGQYRFEVRAADLHRNVDPTPGTHLFQVAFPLWQRPAFYLPMGTVGAIALIALMGLLRNHTALRKYRDELEDRVKDRTATLEARKKELENAVSEIKTLRGIIPICASCKKIRDDEGFWSQVEVYVSDHTEADFTHGICPECFNREMKEIKRQSSIRD